ncbi:hypothetical protein DL767_004076 [Monosporascus sp. MG133]|nr:hypothetical protein DL767_004076 [Monosporascus sp. MG133]
MAPTHPNGGARHNADFIKRFTEREAQRQGALNSAQRAARNCGRYAFSCQWMLNVLKSILLLEPWLQAVRNADRATVMDFLDHLCETYNITSWEIVDGEKKKPDDNSLEKLYGPKAVHAHKTIRKLAKLDSEYGKDNAEDKLSDKDDKLFEEMLLAEIIGRGRPKALCYEDILLMVVRYPVTGEDVYVMAVKFIYHKGADNKPKPIVLNDNVFNAPNLTNVKAVFGVKNLGPVKCTPLRWKKEWLKRPIFRRFNGLNISENEALQYAKLRDDMARQSFDAGEEKPMQPKDWRRRAANEANGNNAVIYEAYEDALIEMLTYISVTRDPRAGRDIVPNEIWQNMPPDPEIVELEQRRERLKGGRYRIKGNGNEQKIWDLIKEIRSKKA